MDASLTEELANLRLSWYDEYTLSYEPYCFSRRVGHPKFAETILDLSLLVGVAGGEETRKPLKSVQLVLVLGGRGTLRF